METNFRTCIILESYYNKLADQRDFVSVSQN